MHDSSPSWFRETTAAAARQRVRSALGEEVGRLAADEGDLRAVDEALGLILGL